MKDYTYVNIECYSYLEMLEIYESQYKQDYQLIGYEHNSVEQFGVLTLYPAELAIALTSLSPHRSSGICPKCFNLVWIRATAINQKHMITEDNRCPFCSQKLTRPSLLD